MSTSTSALGPAASGPAAISQASSVALVEMLIYRTTPLAVNQNLRLQYRIRVLEWSPNGTEVIGSTQGVAHPEPCWNHPARIELKRDLYVVVFELMETSTAILGGTDHHCLGKGALNAATLSFDWIEAAVPIHLDKKGEPPAMLFLRLRLHPESPWHPRSVVRPDVVQPRVEAAALRRSPDVAPAMDLLAPSAPPFDAMAQQALASPAFQGQQELRIKMNSK